MIAAGVFVVLGILVGAFLYVMYSEMGGGLDEGGEEE